MRKDQAALYVNNGSSQKERYLPALDPDYFKIDDRTPQEIVYYMYLYSKIVKYYDHTNKVTDNWECFFLKGRLILLGLLKSLDLEGIEAHFQELKEKVHNQSGVNPKRQNLRHLSNVIIELATLISLCDANLKFDENTQVVIYEIKDAINSKLSTSLKLLYKYNELFKEKENIAFLNELYQLEIDHTFETKIDLTAFLKGGLGDNLPIDMSVFDGTNLTEKLNKLSDRIEDIYYDFHEALVFIKKRATIAIENAFFSTQNNAPHISLFIAFANLFKHSQEILNTINKRHLDLYFRDILKQKELSVVPDQVFLYFIIDKAASYVEIPKREALIAGKGKDNNEIIYTLDTPVYANQAVINDFKNIFVSKNHQVYGDGKKDLVTGIFSNANPTPEPSKEINKKWLSFGEDQFFKGSESRTMDSAPIGFMIAADNFCLAHGERIIKITFQFTSTSFNNFLTLLKDGNKKYFNSFIDVCKDAFLISITSLEGWKDIPQYTLTFIPESFSWSIEFKLGIEANAFSAYDEKIHLNRISTTKPVIKVYLNPESRYYAYSFMNTLELSDIRIDTSVKGVRNVTIFNEFGQISPDKPFQILGVQPIAGSYFTIGSNEIFLKKIKALKLEIDWYNLPSAEGGFNTYFKSYSTEVYNNDYKVTVQALKDGKWYPQQVSEKYFLFDSDPINGKLYSKTIIDIKDCDSLNLTGSTGKIDEIYSAVAKNGFLKVELASPEFGFGHKDYLQSVSNVLYKNAYSKKRDVKVEEPNLPFVPIVKNISLDYDASFIYTKAAGTINAAQFFHIHPFGYDEIDFLGDNQKSLLPDYSDEGSLFLGIKGVTLPDTIALLFLFAQSNFSSTEEEMPTIKWSYLGANNNWITFNKGQVISDTTKNFTQSGIIQLFIPPSASENNTILSSGQCWLKASVTKGAELVNKLINIYTNGVSATCMVNPDSDAEWEPLPPFTIKSFKKIIPGIKAVMQPSSGFGGKGKETESNFYTRVSESLRHRNRAVTMWDYERLVLEKFPEIAFVKCFPATRANPGTIKIVVIPKVGYMQFVNSYRPGVSTTKLLAIREYLKDFTPPFVKIDVANPFYERMKVICKVQFTNQGNQGMHLNQLQEDIKKFLSPWLLDGSYENRLGINVSKAGVLSFLQKLPYIKFITSLSLVKTVDEKEKGYSLLDSASATNDEDELEVIYPWSLITSSYNHFIEVLGEKIYQSPVPRGIGNLELGADFIINDKD